MRRQIKNTTNFLDWERTVLLELNSEHEYICRTHKVNLRPIGIELFDSETLWGQFDSLTRTILISRKLVNEYSWQHVLGVFRHEMAHQFVAEQYPCQIQSSQPHHGEIFKDACKRLGVPSTYAKAGIDLQNSKLDWRIEPRNEVTEKLFDKVKKLLALGNSTNEHEAHLAMERVRELYAKYNLEHLEKLTQEKFVHLIITSEKKKMPSWEQRTISMLIEHFFVKIILFKQFEAKTCKKVQAIEFIGTRENVVMAEYVYYFLLQQAEFLLQQQLKNNQKLNRSERASFKLGVLNGFDKKLKLSNKTTFHAQTDVKNNNELTIIGRALEKFRHDPQLSEYISELYPRLWRKRKTSVEIHKDVFAAGHSAGFSINLNKPVSTSMGNLGRFISSN